MVLNKYRKKGDGFLKFASLPFMRFNPNTVTIFAIISAGFAGISYFYGLFILAFFFVLFNSLFDAIDGFMAKLKGTASKRGDFLDHIMDRYADTFMILGIAFSGYCSMVIGIFGLTGVYFTSYMGTQAQAVGVRRDYGGILGRADRLVMLMFGTLISIFVIDISIFNFHITIFEIIMLWFGIAGHATAIQRGLRTWKILS